MVRSSRSKEEVDVERGKRRMRGERIQGEEVRWRLKGKERKRVRWSSAIPTVVDGGCANGQNKEKERTSIL